AAACPARRLVISVTCLLAWRRPAAFAGVGVLISFAPLPALSLVASLTEGTLVATSGTFAQFGVYFLDPRTVSAHMTGLLGTIVREPRPVREGCRGSHRRDGAAGATILPHGASHPVPADRAVRLRVARRRRRQPRLLGGVREPRGQARGDAARRPRGRVHPGAPPAVRPGGVPDRPVRPAQLR